MKVRTQISQRTTPVSKIYFCGSKRFTSLLALLTIGVCSVVTAGQVTLTWNANTESDLSGYKVHYGLSGGSYETVLDVGNQTSAVISGLADGSTYEFAVTAYNSDGVESAYSSAVSYTAPTANANMIWLEAENGILTSPMQVASALTDTSGDYIAVPNGTLTKVSDPAEGGGHASYSFTIPASGNYVVWGRINAPSSGDDSFFVTIDDGSYAYWTLPISTDGSWIWDRISDVNGASPVVYNLSAGTHTLHINQREDGTNLDKILITNDMSYTPTGVGGGDIVVVNALPMAVNDTAETDQDASVSVSVLSNDSDPDGDALTIIGVSQGSNGQVTIDGATVTYSPAAGFYGNDTFSYTIADGNGGEATGQVSLTVVQKVEPATTMIWLEAEDGNLASPMQTVSNSAASAGSAIIVPNGILSKVSDPAVEGGYAEYTVTIASAGDYIIWGRVNAPTPADDSFFVAVDGTDYAYWQPTRTSSDTWDWDIVSNRNVADPVVYYLTAGEHTIHIHQREDGTSLDKLLITDDMTYVPQGTGEPAVIPDLAPVAENDSTSTTTGTPVTISVLVNDTDANGDALSVTAVTQAANGSVIYTAQTVTYTPSVGFSGSDSFTYTVSDGNGGTASATVTVEVLQVPAIISTPATEAFAGETYVYDVMTTGYPQPALTLISAPTGMTLDPQSGHIQWSPQTGGDYTVVVEAANEAGSVRQEFAISVIDPAALPELPTTNEPTTSETTWTLALDIENTTAAGQLIISQATTAGDNIDTGLDEAITTDLPAYLEGPETTPKLVTDVRSSYANRIKWILAVDQANAIMRWNGADESTQTSLTIAELDANGALIPNTEIDMTLDSELILGDAGTRYCISRVDLATTYEVIDITAGWNLISFSLQGDDDSVANVFAGLNDGPVWSFNASTGTYEAATTVQPKVGYWFYSNEDTILVHLGKPATDGLVSLNKGWNLIGALDTCPVPDNSALVTQAIWELNPTTKQYQNATSFSAGAGYWIYATEATDIILK